MEVGKKTILNQFIGGNNSTQFVIPIYQRNYVWEKKNVEQLLSDIEKMIDYIEDDNVFHFFGSIVYIDTLHKGSFNEWTIIDGQQRLTTIFLFLQALKIVYPENEKVILKKYLVNDEDIINTQNELDRYRLKPLVSDDNVYIKISQNNFEELNDEEKSSNVYNAFTTIKNKLNVWKEKYDIDALLGALDKFKIVWIQLEKTENPQQVFESINSTGVNLTAADLIRNFVLMNKDNDTQTSLYNQYWKAIEFKNVGTKNLKEFFRYYVSIKEKRTIAEREVYEEFKKIYKQLEKNNSEDDILENIRKYSEYYYWIKTEIKNEPEIEKALQDYRNSNSNMPNIILMEILNLYKDEQKISKNDVINSIDLITSYNIRRNIAGEETKAISSMFGGLLGRTLKYFEENGNQNFYECLVRALVNDTRLTTQHMPTDNNIIEEFMQSNLYSRVSVSFILKKIENNENRIPYSQLNIEHIMPQTMTKYWESKVLDKENYDDIVNRIGNLTLVDSKDNSSMGNSNFDAKKNVLEKSKHIKMNESIINKNEWNEEEINKRSKELAEEFIKIFKYPTFKAIDAYSNLNLNNDELDSISVYLANSKPLSITINNEPSIQILNWADVLLVCLKKLYEENAKAFLEAVEKINNEDSKYSNKIGTDEEKFGNPVEFVEGLYCETRTKTRHKINFLQKLLKETNSNLNVNVAYIKDDEKIN